MDVKWAAGLGLDVFFINNGLTEFDPDLNSSFESDGDESDSNEEPTKEFANFGLPALREIRMTARDHEGATEISEVEGAFLHPYVETIRSSGLDWRYEIALDQSWTSIKSNVRVLELADCVIDGKGLKDVFRRCPDLQSLSIRLGGDRRLIGVVGTMDPYKIHSIRDVLGKYGRKLNTLNLHTIIHDWWSSRDGNKSLTQLTKLRHLACFKNDFTGYKLPSDSYKLSPNPDSTVMKLKDVLPTGLETVYLHATYEDIHSVNSKTVNDDLYEVMMGSDFPNLLEVKVARRMQHKHPIVSDFRGWSVDRKVEELRQDDWAVYGKYEVTSFRKGIPTEGVSRLTGPSAGGFCSNDHELL